MNPPLPDYKTMFNQACAQIEEAIGTVVAKFNAFVKHVHDNRYFLGPALLIIKNHLHALRVGVDKLCKLVQYLFDHQLPIVSLIVQSFHWVNDIHSPMSNLSGQVLEPRRESFRAWSGLARDGYNFRAGEQKAAIDDYTKKADFISKWLMDIVKTNVAFVAQLAGTVAKVAGGMVKASGETVTVVMIPFAAEEIAKLISTLVEEGIKAMVTYAENFVGALANIRDAAAQSGNKSVFTDGKWPVAVVN